MELCTSIVGEAGISRKQFGILAAIGAAMALALAAAALVPVLGALAIFACRGRRPQARRRVQSVLALEAAVAVAGGQVGPIRQARASQDVP